MNREIKFRAWNAKANEYQTGWCWPIQMLDPGFEPELPEGITLQQFTGLKDKNGREIYEGDILEWPCYGATYIDEPPTDRGVVIYERGGFRRTGPMYMPSGGTDKEVYNQYLLTPAHRSWGFPDEDDYEILGNIYENPELLSKPTAA